MDSSSDSEQVYFFYEHPQILSLLAGGKEVLNNKVKYMIESGEYVNIARIKDNLEILQHFLSQDGELINKYDPDGETILSRAVKFGRLESVKKFIRDGASVNIPNLDGVTPLHMAVPYPDIAHLLVLHGAQINSVDDSGNTPLHIAISHGCLETVCMLLYYNADANAVGQYNITPFMTAIERRNIEIQCALFEYVDDFNICSMIGMSTLSTALGYGTPLVEDIIKRGADVNYAASGDKDVTSAFYFCLIIQIAIISN